MNADQTERRNGELHSEGMNVAGTKVEVESSESEGTIQNVNGSIRTRRGNLWRYLGKVM